jgi:hypothetical protein
MHGFSAFSLNSLFFGKAAPIPPDHTDGQDEYGQREQKGSALSSWYRIDAHGNSPSASAIVVAGIAQGTLGAARVRALAEFLTMLS